MSKNKVVMVTGGAQGIGAAIVDRLAKNDYNVAIADLNEKQAEKMAGQLNEDGHNVMAVKVDVASRESMFNAVQTVANHFGGFDVLINNAGLGPVTPIKEISPKQFNQVMDVNVGGDIWGIQAAIEQFENKSRHGDEIIGKIINATSQAGVVGNKNTLVYSSSKFAVRGLTQVAARDLADKGITVNAYAPGIVETPMMEAIAKNQGLTMDDYKSAIALKRLSSPDDVAKVVEFLVGENSDYITGQTILCDGGIQFQ